MQKNRSLERNLVNKKAMFLAIRLPFVLCAFFFSQLYLNMQRETGKNCNGFEIKHLKEIYALD